jgi:DNA-binding NarL/FixJ family response regulator
MEDMVPLIRLVLADDHRSIRRAVKTALSIAAHVEVVAEAANGHEAIDCTRQHHPDILLLDLSMQGPSAVEIVRTLAREAPRTRVLILSAYDAWPGMRALLESGIRGYLLKDDAPEELLLALEAVARGEKWYSRSIVRRFRSLFDLPEAR